MEPDRCLLLVSPPAGAARRAVIFLVSASTWYPRHSGRSDVFFLGMTVASVHPALVLSSAQYSEDGETLLRSSCHPAPYICMDGGACVHQASIPGAQAVPRLGTFPQCLCLLCISVGRGILWGARWSDFKELRRTSRWKKTPQNKTTKKRKC